MEPGGSSGNYSPLGPLEGVSMAHFHCLVREIKILWKDGGMWRTWLQKDVLVCTSSHVYAVHIQA